MLEYAYLYIFEYLITGLARYIRILARVTLRFNFGASPFLLIAFGPYSTRLSFVIKMVLRAWEMHLNTKKHILFGCICHFGQALYGPYYEGNICVFVESKTFCIANKKTINEAKEV